MLLQYSPQMSCLQIFSITLNLFIYKELSVFIDGEKYIIEHYEPLVYAKIEFSDKRTVFILLRFLVRYT